MISPWGAIIARIFWGKTVSIVRPLYLLFVIKEITHPSAGARGNLPGCTTFQIGQLSVDKKKKRCIL